MTSESVSFYFHSLMAFFLINLFLLTFRIVPFLNSQDAVLVYISNRDSRWPWMLDETSNSSTGGELGFVTDMSFYLYDLSLFDHSLLNIFISVPSLIHHNSHSSVPFL